MEIITIANQKGGVGKTTTAVNLATAISAVGKRVLLVDLDPQGNASTGVGLFRESRRYGSYEMILGHITPEDAIVSTIIPNLDLIPATPHLSGAEVELIGLQEREFRLKKAFEQLSYQYDYVFLDCPPSLGLLTVNAFVASNHLLVPLQCEYYALEGLSQLVQTHQLIKSNLNKNLRLHGIVLTMFDKRSGLNLSVVNDVKSHFGNLVYDTVIPRNVKVSEAPSYGKPVIMYNFRSPGAQSYIMLAKEFLMRMEGVKQNDAA
jgi:chromosome partitioning protein